ncbi:hypothetical protein [Bradyrhizobium sp. USDA 4452]
MNSYSNISPNVVAFAFAVGAGLAFVTDHGWAGLLLGLAALACVEG